MSWPMIRSSCQKKRRRSRALCGSVFGVDGRATETLRDICSFIVPSQSSGDHSRRVGGLTPICLK